MRAYSHNGNKLSNKLIGLVSIKNIYTLEYSLKGFKVLQPNQSISLGQAFELICVRKNKYTYIHNMCLVFRSQTCK